MCKAWSDLHFIESVSLHVFFFGRDTIPYLRVSKSIVLGKVHWSGFLSVNYARKNFSWNFYACKWGALELCYTLTGMSGSIYLAWIYCLYIPWWKYGVQCHPPSRIQRHTAAQFGRAVLCCMFLLHYILPDCRKYSLSSHFLPMPSPDMKLRSHSGGIHHHHQETVGDTHG